MRRALLGALLALLAWPAAAGAHSIVRVQGADIAYTSSDATSLNTLVVRPAGNGEIEFRDPTVDGGIDPGSCRPGETDAQGFVIQVFCPGGPARLLRIDLGEREDGLDVAAGIASQVLGGPGADRLRTAGAPDVLVGGDGDDTVDAGAGDDKVLGGAGDDRLSGGEGRDELQAGLGADDVDGGPGDDVLRVRDGVRDVVRCGEGADTVDADTLDELDGCEQVTRAVTAAPAGSAGAADRTAPKLRAGARVVQRLRRRAVEVLAVSSESGTVAASGFLDVGETRLPVPTVRRRVATAGQGVRIAIRLSRAQERRVRAALRRGRRVVVRVGVVATDAAGNSRQARVPAIRVRR